MDMAKQKNMVICNNNNNINNNNINNNNNNMASAFIRDQDFDCRQRECEVIGV